MSRPIRSNPATATGAGSLAVSALLTGLGADPRLVIFWNSLAVILTIGVRYLDVHGGLHGLWNRLWFGKDRG